MIDDSILSMVAIGLTLLCLGLINGFQYAETRLPADALPQIRLPLSPTGDNGEQTPIIKPGTLITGALAPLSAWVAKLGQDHPLVGRVWDSGHKESVLPAEVAKAAADADVVLVGETHDNPDHHKLQAWLIREIALKNKHPAIVMEMIGGDKAETLASYQGTPGASADGLGSTLDWASSGWPDWKLYRPIAEAALGAGFTILPGDASKAQIQQVGLSGLRAIPDYERDRLAVGKMLPARLNAALVEDIKVSHCNQLPEAGIGQMTDVQRFRDAVLAENTLKAAQRAGSAILIAGAGHVRSDRGVPYYLHARSPALKVVTIVFTEVEAGVENPEDAVPRDPDGKPAANFVWFTPKSERLDQCEELRRQLQQKSSAG